MRIGEEGVGAIDVLFLGHDGQGGEFGAVACAIPGITAPVTVERHMGDGVVHKPLKPIRLEGKKPLPVVAVHGDAFRPELFREGVMAEILEPGAPCAAKRGEGARGSGFV